MNESRNNEDQKSTGPAKEDLAGDLADDNLLGPDDDDDVYAGQGFDPEQRRFLWTVTGVLVLAILGASGINIAYMERQRSKAMSVARAGDDYNTWKTRLSQAQSIDGSAMINAYLKKDDEAYKRALEDVLNAFRSERRAFIALRREQGFDEPPLSEAFVDEYQNYFTKTVMDQAEQNRKMRGASATQAAPAATAPSGSAGATTNP